MAASTPAQEEPAQPPSTNSPLPTDSRDDSVTNDESAPLLDADDRAPPARNASTNLHYIFTSTALSSSFLTLIFIIAGTIALNVGENENWHGLPWGWSESMVPMIVPVMTPSTQRLFCPTCSHASGHILPFLLSVQPCKITSRPWYSSPRAQHAVRCPGGSLCKLLRNHWAIRHKLRAFRTSEDLSRDSSGDWDHLRYCSYGLVCASLSCGILLRILEAAVELS